MIIHEIMNPGFEKWHLNPMGDRPWPFRPVLHKFSAPDLGDPHDHPWDFQTFVLKGSYVEEKFSTYFGTKRVTHHRQGETRTVKATDIHRIVDLPDGECWTLVLAGPKIREPRFWRFDDGVTQSRQWDEVGFTLWPSPL